MKDSKSLIRSLFLSGLCLLLIVGSGTIAAAQQVSRVVAVSIGEVNGSAEVLLRRDAEKGKGDAQILSQAWKPAAPQVSINAGDQLRTNSGASLKLNLNDGTILTLAENSLMVVENLQSARDNQPRTAEFRLENGTVSTVQTAKTLGQTVQIVRTTNGSVDTRLGEVEITKISEDYPKVAAVLSEGKAWPFIVQHSGSKDRTFVRLVRGTAQIQASGQGSIVTDSMLLPSSCIAEDGVQFTLRAAKAKVKIAKLPDINAFEFSSEEPFQLLVGTEGEANKVKLFNRTGKSEIDIEGISIAEQEPNATLNLLLHSLLTIGVKASEMTVSLECTQDQSEGLGFKVLGKEGGVNILRSSLGEEVGRGLSRGAVSAVPTRTPVPTVVPTVPTGEEVPEHGERRRTPTPTPTQTTSTTDSGGGVPAWGCGEPITHIYSRNPKILPTGISGVVIPRTPPDLPLTISYDAPSITSLGSCGGTSMGVLYRVKFAFENALPQIMPGKLTSFIIDGSGGYAPSFHGVIQTGPGGVSVTNYNYSYSTQKEYGYITYSFCYNLASSLRFYVYIYDRCGNQSNRMTCDGTATGITCH